MRRAWGEPIRRLIVFDNLEEPRLLAEWRPAGGGARVLITTRRGVWAATSGVRAVPLPPLARPESLRLLLAPRHGDAVEVALADPVVAAEADAICAQIGDLPLALALAGAYLEQSPRLPLARYRARLEAELLAHPSLEAAHARRAAQGGAQRAAQGSGRGRAIGRRAWGGPIPVCLCSRQAAKAHRSCAGSPSLAARSILWTKHAGYTGAMSRLTGPVADSRSSAAHKPRSIPRGACGGQKPHAHGILPRRKHKTHPRRQALSGFCRTIFVCAVPCYCSTPSTPTQGRPAGRYACPPCR